MTLGNKTPWILTFMLVVLWAMPGSAMAARVAGNDRPVNTSGETPIALPPPPGYGNAQKAQTAPPAEPANETAPAQPVKKKSTPKKKATTTKAQQPAKKTTARPPQATGSIPAEANKAKYITMDFDNVDIAVFVKFMSEMTHRNFVIDDNVKGKITVFSPRKISVDEAYKVFESVLEVHGLTAVPSGDVTKIIQAKDAKEKNIETRLRAQAVSPHDKIVTQIISLNHANPDDMKKVLDPLISRTSVIVSYPPTGMLIITDVLSNVKRLLSIISALDVTGVGEQISVIPLKHAGATEMVNSLNSIFGADATAARRTALPYAMKIIPDERTNAVLVRASEVDTARVRELVKLLDREAPKGESRMQVYRLQYANAEDLAKILMNLPVVKEAKTPAAAATTPRATRSPTGTEVQIAADKATNTLIITASKDDYRTLEEVIKKIDVPRAMVYLEALLMEVSVTKDFKVGVEWRFLKDTGGVPGFDTGRSAAFGGSGGLGPGGSYSIIPGDSTAPSFPSGFSLGVIGAGISIGNVIFPNIGAVLQAVQQDSDVYILSNPQLLTSDNEEATVIVGKNIPYITRQERSTTNVDYTNYEYKDVGVTLKITPTINTEKFVRQKIDLEVTQLVTAESSTGLPTTLKRATKTVVSVKDGQTIVISGIMGDSTEKAVYKVPLLGDIPILGWLFKSRSDIRDKTNLYVFITPHVIENQTQGAAIKEKKQKEIETFEGGVIKGYKWRDFGIDSPRSPTAPTEPIKPEEVKKP